MNVANVVVMVIVHHRCILHYNCLLDKLARAGPFHRGGSFGLRGPLVHHFVLLASCLVCNLLILSGGALGLGADLACVDVILTFVFVPLFSVYTNAFVSVAELIFVGIVDGLTSKVRHCVSTFKESAREHKDLSSFCERQKLHFEIVKDVESAFGGVIFVLFAFSMVIMTVNTYFAFANMVNMVWQDRTASFLTATGQVIAAFVPAKRMLHLANHTQRLANVLDETAETLIMHRSSSQMEALEAEQARMLLERCKGLDVLGLFTLNRAVLLGGLGQLLTYLIILIEFKMDDKNGS